jgi:hypothetical protein
MSTCTSTGAPLLTARAALPGALLLTLFGIFAVLAVIAPGRGDDGQIYAIAVSDDQDGYIHIPRDSLFCSWANQVSTCSVEVAGRSLQASMAYGPDPGREISCTARYGGRSIPCQATYDYTATGLGAVAVLPSGLGLTAGERDRFANSMSWGSEPEEVTAAVPIVIGALAVLAALVAGFGGRRPVVDGRYLVWVVGVGWVVTLGGGMTLVGGRPELMLHPATLAVGGLLLYWQWTLTRPGRRHGSGRAAGAFAMTVLVSATALFMVLLSGAFID